MQFVNANIFVRVLAGDHPEHSPSAYAFLKNLDSGEIRATTSESVVMEVVYVLSSRTTPRMHRNDIADRLRALLRIRGLVVPHAEAIWDAAGYETSLVDFVNCLSAAHMKRQDITEIVSFDRDFDRLSWVTRVEP